MSAREFTAGQAVSAADLDQAGLLHTVGRAAISPYALFVPADELGTARPVEIGPDCTVAAYAVIWGGTVLRAAARIEEHTVVGKPEQGYAVGRDYPGAGGTTTIGPGVVLRSGAVVYAGAGIGEATVIGHHTLLRSAVTIGRDSQLGHHLTVERAVSIGDGVRCSPGSHITSSCVLADGVFLGAGIRTVNDRELIWRDPDREADLCPPRFGRGARVGSGSTVLGVIIGEGALVGAGSVVTRDIPARSVAWGTPARVRRAVPAGRA